MNFPPGIGETDSIVNLDEKIGKVVGVRKAVPPQEAYEKLSRMTRAVTGGVSPFPRGGVVRFKSFEEANAWEKHYIMKRVNALHRETRPWKTSPESAAS